MTGYNVERSPAGCSSFTEVYNPSGASQADTGRSASTLYCYQVRAHDAAGNLSGYSSIQQATALSLSLPTVNAAAGRVHYHRSAGLADVRRKLSNYRGGTNSMDRQQRDVAYIQHVIHVGDLVNTASIPAEWVNASNFMTTLDTAKIPYSISMGNHDVDPGTQQSTGAGATFRTYFPLSRFSSLPTYFGFYTSGNNQRNQMYHKFTVNGQCYLVLALDYQAPDDLLTHAATITAANPTCRVIISVHYYLDLAYSPPRQCRSVHAHWWKSWRRYLAKIYPITTYGSDGD